jgi:hypothetical protein
MFVAVQKIIFLGVLENVGGCVGETQLLSDWQNN